MIKAWILICDIHCYPSVNLKFSCSVMLFLCSPAPLIAMWEHYCIFILSQQCYYSYITLFIPDMV